MNVLREFVVAYFSNPGAASGALAQILARANRLHRAAFKTSYRTP